MSKLNSTLHRSSYSRAITLGILFTCALAMAVLFLTSLSDEILAEQQGAEDQSDPSYALSFDGTDDYVKLPNWSLQDLTLEAWFKPTTMGGQRIIISRDNDIQLGLGGWRGSVPDDKLAFTLELGAANWITIGSERITEDNIWYHVAATYDHSTMKMFINGQLEAEQTAHGDIYINVCTWHWHIGAEHAACSDDTRWHWPGVLDEVRVWNYARSQNEIQSTMSATLVGDESGLVGYWKFDEGEGQIASDSSGYDRNGILGSTSDIDDHDPSWSDPLVELVPEPYDIDHNSAPSAGNWSPTVADPVNVVFGNYTYQYTDLTIPSLGPDTALERTYNSASDADGPLGYGWVHTYVVTATNETTDTVLIKNEDSRLDRFTEDESGDYAPPPGVFNVLTENADSTFSLTYKDQTVYNFNTAGRLSSIVDKNGNTTTMTYASDNLTAITDAVGRTTTLTYDADNHITQITGPAGRTVNYSYDADGNLVSVIDARGYTTTYTYDDQHRLLSITDANGHTFVTNSYDTEGRVIEQQDALGNVTTFQYDRLNRRTTVTDPLGNQTVYAYDADWRVVSETDALGNTETYTYDAQNNRTAVTDRRGNVTGYAYDDRGNTTVITDTLSFTTTMTYDSRNNLTGKTDALNRSTAYAYDANSNLVSVIDPLSNTTTYAYNAQGQRISTTDARGNTTQYAYDQYGYRTVITDAVGNATAFSYDTVGRKLSQTDVNGNTTTSTYDPHNNLLTETDPLGGVTTYTYDDVGNRISVTDALSRTTTYAYDAKDRLASVTDPEGNSTTYTYDANNNRTAITDANGNTTTYTYDAVDRVASVEDALGNTTTYGYDANGNRTSVTDPNGHQTTFTYDTEDRLIQVTDPLGHTTQYTYDAVGNKTSLTDANGNTTSYTYDALNRLLNITDAMSGTVTYAYDSAGNKTSMIDANGHTTAYTYDALNRLATVTDPEGNTTTHSYDAVGNKASMTDANGQVADYAYDALNRRTTVDRPDETVAYAYDAVGNRTAMTDTVGVTTYVYDDLDRLSQITDSAGDTIGYGYDAVGNRTAITYPSGDSVLYAYDAADRMISVTDWVSRTVTYTYDAAGNLLSQTNPNGTSTTYTYDAADRLTELVNSGPTGVISSFAYDLDAVGNRTRITEADGDYIDYSYDALYRLTDVQEQLRVDFNTDCSVNIADIQASAAAWGTADPTFDLDGNGVVNAGDVSGVTARWRETCEQSTYAYDPMGNRTSLTTPTGTFTYTYDAADRLLNISDGTAFTWDANGNQLSKGSTTYAYDTANRLTQVDTDSTTVQFTYDGDGKRTSKSVDAATTSYTYDVNTALPVVLVESTAAGDTRYIHGLDLLACVEPNDTTNYYHYDGLGSTRQLTDEAGESIASYKYKAFGALEGQTDNLSNVYTFTGAPMDERINLIYLRARYYAPSIGRFVSGDPFAGFEEDSQSLNRYVYVRNNPVILVDPSGKYGVSEFVADIADRMRIIIEYIETGGESFSQIDALGLILDSIKRDPDCKGNCQEQVDDASDALTLVNLVSSSSPATPYFTISKILSRPERYIDPWLDPINEWTGSLSITRFFFPESMQYMNNWQPSQNGDGSSGYWGGPPSDGDKPK